MNPLDLIKPYTTIIVAIAALALLAFCYLEGDSHGKKVVQSQWDKEKVISLATAAKATQDSIAKERTAATLSTDIQTGGTNAIKSIYAWYAAHPTVKYVLRPAVLPNSTTCTGCGGMSKAAEGTGINLTKPTDNGPATDIDPEQIQVEPNPLERCAETTVQALECRNYVLGLTSILNKE